MDAAALGALLVEANCLSQAKLDDVLARAPFVGEDRVAADISALAVENEAAVCEILSEKMQAPALVLSTSTLDLRALLLIPAAMIREHRVLPVLSDGATLTVAATKPELPALIGPLEVATGHRIVVVVALEPLLLEAIESAFRALSEGEVALHGSRSQSALPLLHLARAPIKVRMPRADSVARALGAVLDQALDPPAGRLPKELQPNSSAAIGALRLKQVLVTRDGARPTPTEGVVVVRARPLCLVVEDDDAIRGLIARILRHDGCDVEEAADGQQGANFLRQKRPDLLVLDAMLPHVHGFEICAAIKRSPTWTTLPIIMVSAVFKGFESAKSIQEVHGADAFLEKPFEVNHLRHVAADLLKRPKPVTTKTQAQNLTAERARALVDHHLTLGEVADADVVLEAWLAADPFSARAWLERGNLSLQKGDDVAALRAYELASTYDATLFIAHLSLAMMYERLGFVRRSRATWEKAAAAAPDAAVAAKIRQQLS